MSCVLTIFNKDNDDADDDDDDDHLWYGSLSQGCQWLSPVRHTKSTEVHFRTRELLLVSVSACDKTAALPQT